jgi:hypothetical protein
MDTLLIKGLAPTCSGSMKNRVIPGLTLNDLLFASWRRLVGWERYGGRYIVLLPLLLLSQCIKSYYRWGTGAVGSVESTVGRRL